MLITERKVNLLRFASQQGTGVRRNGGTGHRFTVPSSRTHENSRAGHRARLFDQKSNNSTTTTYLE